MSWSIALLQGYSTAELVDHFRGLKKEYGFTDSRELEDWRKTFLDKVEGHDLLSSENAKYFQVLSILEELDVRGVQRI